MQKPSGYDEARVSGEFTPVRLGGHYCVIKQVSEKLSSTGKDMIVVLFDFCEPDDQAGYFKKAFDNDDRDERKWPFQGSKYIMVNDYQDSSKTSRNFKTFISLVEKSNNMQVVWGGTDWGKQFAGKKIGAVYGNVESEYNGEVRTRPEVRWFCKTDAVDSASVPDPKLLNKTGSAVPVNAASFFSADDTEIPF